MATTKKNDGILRGTVFTSSTGRTYVIDANGTAVQVKPVDISRVTATMDLDEDPEDTGDTHNSAEEDRMHANDLRQAAARAVTPEATKVVRSRSERLDTLLDGFGL